MYSVRFKRGGHRTQLIYKILVYYDSRFLTNLGVYDFNNNLCFINLGKLRYYWSKGLNLNSLYSKRRYAQINLIFSSLLVLESDKMSKSIPTYFPPSQRVKLLASIRKSLK